MFAHSGAELSLRINFRLCADCHAWMSNASVMLRRRITVREPKQAHTFDKGSCSCEPIGAKAARSGGNGGSTAAPDRTSINAAIAACAREGRWREALGLLDGMPEVGMEPQMDSYRSAMQVRAACVGPAPPCAITKTDGTAPAAPRHRHAQRRVGWAKASRYSSEFMPLGSLQTHTRCTGCSSWRAGTWAM